VIGGRVTGADDVAWYYRSLVKAFEARQFEGAPRALLAELTLAVDELERCVRASRSPTNDLRDVNRPGIPGGSNP